MAIDYIAQVQALENLEMSDAEIAALLAASTTSDIPVGELENYLTFQGLATRNPFTGSWEGTLPDEISNNVYGLGPGLAALFSHMNKPRSTVIDTTVSPWSSDAAALTAGLVAAGLLTAQQRDDFYDFGGGLPNAGLTEADVGACRSDYIADQARAGRQLEADEKFNEYLSPVLNDIDATDADIAAALVVWADSYTE